MANEARLPKMMRCIVGLPEESMKVYNHFDRLCDELLTEILLRLPNCKSVIQSTTVCKHWAALASRPCFIPNFIALKLGDSNEQHTIAFVIHYMANRICPFEQRFESFFRPSIFYVRDQDSSFSPLGDYDIAPRTPGAFSSCKDLLLYYKNNDAKLDFYIINVQTSQRVALPSLRDYYGKVIVVGFICESLFNCDREPAAYHYSVVVVPVTPKPSSKFHAHVLSSYCDTQWCNRVLALPKTCGLLFPSPTNGFYFCFDGRLHFSCLQGVFGFDHKSIAEFDDEIQCHLVEWPVGMLLGCHRVCVSQENLFLTDYSEDKSVLSVWVLQDYKEGKWMLQHKVETCEWVARDSWMVKKLINFFGRRLLGLHPSRSDVIYVVIPGHIFLCNLATKMVELACDIPVTKRHKNRKHINSFYAFPVIFQKWPTPLPRLAPSLKDDGN